MGALPDTGRQRVNPNKEEKSKKFLLDTKYFL